MWRTKRTQNEWKKGWFLTVLGGLFWVKIAGIVGKSREHRGGSIPLPRGTFRRLPQGGGVTMKETGLEPGKTGNFTEGNEGNKGKGEGCKDSRTAAVQN